MTVLVIIFYLFAVYSCVKYEDIDNRLNSVSAKIISALFVTLAFFMFFCVFSIFSPEMYSKDFTQTYKITSIEKAHENNLPIILINSDYGQIKVPYNDYNVHYYIFTKANNSQQSLSVTKRWPKTIAKILNPFAKPYTEYNIRYNANLF